MNRFSAQNVERPMSLRLGTLLLLSSGCATVAVHDENTDRIDAVLSAREEIAEPLVMGEAPAVAAVLPPAAGSDGLPVPEGYRVVTGRRGRRVLMRDPNYLGVDIGDVKVGDVSIGPTSTRNIGITGASGARGGAPGLPH